VWETANRIGPTLRTWEQEEADIRSRYPALQAMSQEERDLAFTQGHLEKVSMLEATLKHINQVLLPIARANELGRAKRKRKPKKKKTKKRGRR
jgi:hypothetical protein